MIYYNQITGERRYVPQKPTEPDTNYRLPAVHTPVPTKSEHHTDTFLSSVKKFLPQKLGINHIHTENLNLDYILEPLETDDILLGAVILLLLTDSADKDMALILALMFLLVSEWIFDDDMPLFNLF